MLNKNGFNTSFIVNPFVPSYLDAIPPVVTATPIFLPLSTLFSP